MIRRSPYYPPTGSPSVPVGVDASLINTRDVRVTWQWKQSETLSSCYSTYVRYQPQGGNISSLRMKKSNATSVDLTGLQCDTTYKITVAVTIYRHERNHIIVESDPVSLHLSPSCGPPVTPGSIAAIFGVLAVALLTVLIIAILVLMKRYAHIIMQTCMNTKGYLVCVCVCVCVCPCVCVCIILYYIQV